MVVAHDFNVWTSDVYKAYLHSVGCLDREVFINNTSVEFELAPNECLRLLKLLYKICKSGDLWHKSLHNYHQVDLKHELLLTDPALYCELSNGKLTGLSGYYVDDMITSGKKKLQERCLQTHNRLEMSDDSSPPCSFLGFFVNFGKSEEIRFLMNKYKYIEKIKSVPLDGNFTNI